MTTAPKLIREQLLADLERVLALKVQADDDEDSESVGATGIDAAYAALQFVVDHRDDIRSLAAEPVGDDLCACGGDGCEACQPDSAEGDERLHFIDGLGWVVKCNEAVRWVAEIQQLAGELRATDDGKGERSCCDDTLPGHALDCPERFQPKSEGVNQAGGFWIEVVDSPYGHGINFSNDFADLPRGTYRLSAAPQPEPIPLGLPGTWLYAVDDALEDMELHGMHDERGYQVLKAMHKAATERTQPEQPARDGVEPFGYYFKDLAGAQHFYKGARIPLFAQSEITLLFAQPPQQADGGLELVASAFNYLGDFPAIDEAWVTNWRNRAEAFLSQQADGGAVAFVASHGENKYLNWSDAKVEADYIAEGYTITPLSAQPPKSPGVDVDGAMRKRAKEWLAANGGYHDDAYVNGLLAALGGEK